MRLVIVILLLIHFGSYAVAETPSPPAPPVELDEVAGDALTDAQKVLRNRKEREKYIESNTSIKEMDAKLGAAVGVGTSHGTQSNKDQMYDMAAEITAIIAREAGGDPLKMQQIASEAQADPKAFYDRYLTPSQKSKVRGIASEVERTPPSAPSQK